MKIKKNKTICFDIDGVICDTKNNNYKNSKPIVKNIKVINILYSKGYYIKLFTARFMGRTNDNKVLAKKKAKILTINQLKKWKVRYSSLHFGKISYDLFVDDKALFFRKNWTDFLKKKLI